jgi:sugar phosphate isomerase/epimerase
LGIVPREYREIRVAALKSAGEFAHQAGLSAVVTHLGFIPEEPKDPMFGEVVDVIRDIGSFLKDLGLEFWFETGQETPVTMLRLIQEVGTGNLGINLDPANLILYGKANPIDALDVFGEYVKSVHAKDGLYPTNPMELGKEVKIGEGRVRFPQFVQRLKDINYEGAFIIEREISGPQQHADIAASISYLESLIG